MPEDVHAVLARLRGALDEDDWRRLANAVGVDPDAVDGAGGSGSGSDVPDDVEEARGEELKADGEADAETAGDTLTADLFLVRPGDGEEADEFEADILGVGVDFPNAGVFVDWHLEAFPDPLGEPHVSQYGSIEDLETATGHEIDLMEHHEVPASDGREPDQGQGQAQAQSQDAMNQKMAADGGSRYGAPITKQFGTGGREAETVPGRNPMAGSSSAGGISQKADGEGAPDEAITEDELEARLEEIREEAVSQADLAEVVDELEASAQKALAEALPGVAEGVAEKMASGGGVDYSDEIGDTYGTGRPATGLEAGRTPTGSGSGRRGGTRQKAAGDGGADEAVDYSEEIEAAFGSGGGG